MTRGIKGTRQKVIITHSPSEIDQNRLLLVRFLNLDSDDFMISGMANLSFNIKLSLTADPRRALLSNIGGAIVKKSAVWTISKCSRATKTCGRQSQKNRMQ